LADFWQIFGLFLADFWQIFGRFLADFWPCLNPAKVNFSTISDPFWTCQMNALAVLYMWLGGEISQELGAQIEGKTDEAALVYIRYCTGLCE
jgi:hypothetical protein